MSLDFIMGVLLSAFLALVVIGTRVITPSVRRNHRKHIEGVKQVMIYGADDAGVLALEEVKRCRKTNAYAVGFIDDNKEIKGQVIDGVRILGSMDEVYPLLNEEHIEEIIIAINKYTKEQEKQLNNNLVAKGLQVSVTRFPTTIPAPT